MRFSAPRSPSPSPERGFSGRSSYGLYPESESESDGIELLDGTSSEFDFSDSESASSESGGSYVRLSDLKITRPEHSSHCSRTDAEMRYIEDTIAAIRLRTRHRDPYEEWERQTRKDAFRTAKRALAESQNLCQNELAKAHAVDLERLSVLHAQQISEVQGYLTVLKQHQQKEEQRLREGWKARDQMLWQRIESVIKAEEEKAMKRVEEERRIMQEAETKRRLEEEKKRLEEEKKKKEEEEARKLKEEKERKEAEEKHRLERQQAEQEQKQKLGFATADEDWSHSRQLLHRLKHEVMKKVKADKELKKQWGDLRRQITPKIGQLTNDDQSILRISEQLTSICKLPLTSPRNRLLYFAILSSLAKAILMQAETEVTAEARTAVPLAKVTARLLSNIQEFGEILHARIVQRVGGLAIPVIVSGTDYDGRPWTDNQERLKVMGYRKGATGEDIETTSEYCTRISGIMRVYFHVLKLRPSKGPLHKMFQIPRCWVWFARMLGGQHRLLLEGPASAFLIHAALDVIGTDAKDIWGIQWIKLLALVYEGVTGGLPIGSKDEKLLIGGQSPEGKSARMRVFLELERIMKTATMTAPTSASKPTLFS